MSSASSNTSTPTKSKRAAIRRTFSSNKPLDKTQSGTALEINSPGIPNDQSTNPDHFDLNQVNYVGTNKMGVVTGFRRISPPTMSKADNKNGKGQRDVAVDSGTFRRYGFHETLVQGNMSLNPVKNALINRPLADYIDGSNASIFNRAVLCWPNLKFYGVRARDPKTRTMKNEFVYRTLADMNTHATNLAKALIGYKLVQEREFHDETFPEARRLTNLAMMIPNREEFHVIEQACNKAKITMVPVYPSLGVDSCKAIFQEIQASSLVIDIKTLKKLESGNSSKSCSWGIDHIILVDSVENDPSKRELAHFLEGTPEHEELERIVVDFGAKGVVRFSNLIKMGRAINDVTVYPADKEYPVVAPAKETYINATFDTGLDGDALYEESVFAKYFRELDFEKDVKFEFSRLNDIQTICYTSGTTGLPKGVLLTHNNLSSASVACVSSAFQTPDMTYGLADKGEHVTESPDSSFSVLPLVHVLERLITGFNYCLGIAINMFSQDPSQLVPEMKICQPSIFVGVPRIFQKILAGVDELVESKGTIVKALYNSGINSKMQYAEKDGTHTHMLWDNLVFNKIKEQICGKNLRTILTGAAPIACSTQYRTESLLSTYMVEGYGLTECMGACAVRIAGDAKGTVGTIMPCLELKLESVVEMDIVDVRDQMKGEICLRGTSVTPGYFRRPDLNKEAFKDGWFHTGDIGQINGGLLSIRDRKKAIFKLAQGEYVSPERVEGFLLSAMPWLENVMCSGRSTSRYACALVILNPVRTEGWTGENVNETSDPDLKSRWEKFLIDNRDAIEKRFLADQQANLALFDMQGYERVMAIHIFPYNITDPELVTPTLKIKRNKVRMKYDKEINLLCDKIDKANDGK